MKTVFFRPFVGEFGWEILFWQGWVRKVCKTTFKDYRKIASSFPGRQPLYPYVDEYWPLTDEFLALKSSAQHYFTARWRHGYPGKQTQSYNWKSFAKALARQEWPQPRSTDTKLEGPDVEPLVLKMLDSFKAKLPADTVIFSAWKLNHFEGLKFGVDSPEIPRIDRVRPYRIPFSQQLLEPISPTNEGRKFFKERFPETRPLISLFPRCRALRRPDKNWPKEKYSQLIQCLRATHVLGF